MSAGRRVCGAASQGGFDHDAPQILSPLRGAVYSLRLAHFVPLALRANSAAAAQTPRELSVDVLP